MPWLTTLLSATSKPFKWWVIVAPWEQGIRIRGGKTVKVLRGGVHFRIPFWDRVYVQSVRQRVISSSGVTGNSKDGKQVTVAVSAFFAINDVAQLYNSVSMPEEIIRANVEAAVISIIATCESQSMCSKHINTEVNKALEALDVSSWGLSTIEAKVRTCVTARTFRLLQTEYNTGANLYNLDIPDSESSGAR